MADQSTPVRHATQLTSAGPRRSHTRKDLPDFHRNLLAGPGAFAYAAFAWCAAAERLHGLRLARIAEELRPAWKAKRAA